MRTLTSVSPLRTYCVRGSPVTVARMHGLTGLRGCDRAKLRPVLVAAGIEPGQIAQRRHAELFERPVLFSARCRSSLERCIGNVMCIPHAAFPAPEPRLILRRERSRLPTRVSVSGAEGAAVVLEPEFWTGEDVAVVESLVDLQPLCELPGPFCTVGARADEHGPCGSSACPVTMLSIQCIP